ncbi:MAG: hypothetical protein M3O31_06300 [Acidobacteriota bacterium]|nr:hypothetical protein [Acidobacteriota bacterium]
MTVFQQVLWLFINIRMLGGEPEAPLQFETLTDYTVALRVQYWAISRQSGFKECCEAEALSRRIIQLLGLVDAARPLPPRLLTLAAGSFNQPGGPAPASVWTIRYSGYQHEISFNLSPKLTPKE